MTNHRVEKIVVSSQFPDYLGFGRLDPESIHLSSQGLTAEYRLGEELVYRAAIGQHESEVEEYFDGQSIGISRQSSLQLAFFHHPTLYEPVKHPRLKRIIDEIQGGSNIFFSLPEKVRFLFFPAGVSNGDKSTQNAGLKSPLFAN